MKWNELAQSIHQDCVDAGWWEPYPNKEDRWNTARVLICSELMEGLEGWRKDLDDDHLPQYKMLHVELADAMIRLLDGAAAWEIDLDYHPDERDLETVKCREVFEEQPIPEQLATTCTNLFDHTVMPASNIMRTFICIIAMADLLEIPLLHIIQEKRAYNATRKDHKREARAAANGKRI